jgi:hypothetical protein
MKKYLDIQMKKKGDSEQFEFQFDFFEALAILASPRT